MCGSKPGPRRVPCLCDGARPLPARAGRRCGLLALPWGHGEREDHLPLLRLRVDLPQVGGPVPRVRGVGHGRPDGPGLGRAARVRDCPAAPRPADRRGGRGTGLVALDGRGRAGQGPRRRHRSRRRHSLGRRARRRQVDAAAGRGREGGAHGGGRWARTRPVRDGRGVGGAGARARGTHRRVGAEPVDRGRDGARRRPRARPAGLSLPPYRRLRADDLLRPGRGRGGRRRPGARGRRFPHPGRQGIRPADPPGRPRHQGRGHRGPARPRAPRGRRLPVRGRPPLAAAPAARGEKPLRPHRRGRLLRTDGLGHLRPGRSVGPVPVAHDARRSRHLRGGLPRGQAPAAHRESSPSSPPPPVAPPGAPRRASTTRASP